MTRQTRDSPEVRERSVRMVCDHQGEYASEWLEREVRELRRTNEILRKASAFFAQAELDRRPT